MNAFPSQWQLDPRQPRSGQIYGALRAAIIGVQLRPRSPLSETTICAQANVSRTPVREAFIRLSQEGLVEVLPQVGSFVSPIRVAKVVEGHFIREALELAILKQASGRWRPPDTERAARILADQERSTARGDTQSFYVQDQAFHDGLAVVAGIPGVSSVVADATVDLLRVRRLSTPFAGHMAEALAEHQGILSAITERDLDTASMVLLRHLRRVFKTVRRLTYRYQEYFDEPDHPAIASAFDSIELGETEVSVGEGRGDAFRSNGTMPRC